MGREWNPVSWLKKGASAEPSEITHLPVVHGTIHEYDVQRVHKGDTLAWVLELTIEQGGETREHKLRFVVEVK